MLFKAHLSSRISDPTYFQSSDTSPLDLYPLPSVSACSVPLACTCAPLPHLNAEGQPSLCFTPSHPPLLSLTAELCKTVVHTCCLTSVPPSPSSAHSLLASILPFTQLWKFEEQAPTWSVARRALPSLPPLTPKLWPPEPTQFLGAHSLWLLRLPMQALLFACPLSISLFYSSLSLLSLVLTSPHSLAGLAFPLGADGSWAPWQCGVSGVGEDCWPQLGAQLTSS